MYAFIVFEWNKEWMTTRLKMDIQSGKRNMISSLIRLAVMEAMTENHEYCAIFFQKINEMLTSLSREQDPQAEEVVFNPFHLKDDEHGGNKIGMVTVFGEDFVRNRTSSCEYHCNL